jgi:hypothetical protein
MSPNKVREAITRPRAPALDDLHAAQDRAAELDKALKAPSAAVARADAESARARNRATELEAQSPALARGVAELDSALTAQTKEAERDQGKRELEIHRILSKVGGEISLARASSTPGTHASMVRSNLSAGFTFKNSWATTLGVAIDRIRLARFRLVLPGISRRPPVRRPTSLVHYLQHGAADGRDPSPVSDSEWYLSQYPDVAASAMNPSVHYLRHGTREDRDPNPAFSTRH